MRRPQHTVGGREAIRREHRLIESYRHHAVVGLNHSAGQPFYHHRPTPHVGTAHLDHCPHGVFCLRHLARLRLGRLRRRGLGR